MTMTYEEEMKIDRWALDEALENQVAIYYKVSMEYADAVSMRDQKKEELAILNAELQLAYRRAYENDGVKYTVDVINSEVIGDDSYKQVNDEYLSSKHAVEQLSATKGAFEQRSYMLKEMCNLFTAGYWAQTSVKGSAHTADEQNYESYRQKSKLARAGKSVA